MLNAMVPAPFQHMQRADNVGVDVGVRVFHAVAHARLRGEVDNSLRLHLGKQPLDARTVGEIELVEGEAVCALKLAETRLLQPNIIVGIEIIDTDDLIASSQ